MQTFIAPVVGAYYRPPAKVLLKYLPADAPLTLQREPENPYDENAVMVLCSAFSIPETVHTELADAVEPYGFTLEEILMAENWHIGYIAKEFAVHLAPLLDQISPKEVLLQFNHENKPFAKITMDLEEGEE